MASRFGPSSLHQRDPRSALFEGYHPGGAGAGAGGGANARSNGDGSVSPNRYAGGGYGYSGGGGGGAGVDAQAYRPATPNKRGQYSDAVLNELESQNDGQVEGILGKVRQLKDMTMAIGDEIRESSALAEKMNDSFDGTRLRLKGTMNRMLVMAERTGVGWKVWLLFFAAVGFLFFWVWI
ncbi:related to ER-Golgi SNARE complex subunit BET1 protein [Rhynchosporium secalis]|uniref:Related to ER-Golgi SNARE complex subunit BET1 protein n=1 Tax=Rhynchosporium secalis TaxID=38038 RepID=A0A1E1LZ90_RHYSE|nr:related to ER-Golgi SNARE complex subunit BET1 protein [Rhynchosporium secalis]